MVSLAGKWPWLEREQDFQGPPPGGTQVQGECKESVERAQLERSWTPPSQRY